MERPSARSFLLLLTVFAFIFSGCRETIESPYVNQGNSRGRVISYELVATWDSTQLISLINSVDPLLTIFFQKSHDIEGYKVTYQTTSFDGTPTTATGALMVPIPRDGSAIPTTLVGYSHGTMISKEAAPSRFGGGGEESIGVLLAGDGYLVAMPDYLGLGDGEGFHPYSHAESQASSVIDILRASISIAEDLSLPTNGDVFLVGYSQGGQSTLATHKEIEANHSDEFNLLGSAPMSGAYDVSGVQEQYMLAFTPYSTPGYLPYILYSYDMVYDILPSGDPTQALKSPYDSIAPYILGQATSIGDINNMCNPIPRLMIEEDYLDGYINDPDHPLKIALRDNDLYLGWTPQAPVRLFYCEGDDQVSYQNSLIAYDAFSAAGAPDVILRRIDQDGNLLDHNECAPGALLSGKLFLDSLANL